MLDPPLEMGGVKLTVAWALPATAETLVGAPGTVNVAVDALLEVAETRPRVSYADREYVYVVEAVRPLSA